LEENPEEIRATMETVGALEDQSTKKESGTMSGKCEDIKLGP
jgi:hypothetical protein